MTMIEKLVNLGGNEWHGGQNHRVYLNKETCAKLIGLQYDTYKTGNISYASLNGEKISNSRCNSILTAIDGIYYNIVTEKFSWRKSDNEQYAIDVISALRAE